MSAVAPEKRKQIAAILNRLWDWFGAGVIGLTAVDIQKGVERVGECGERDVIKTKTLHNSTRCPKLDASQSAEGAALIVTAVRPWFKARG
jgi:hypothetical protein